MTDEGKKGLLERMQQTLSNISPKILKRGEMAQKTRKRAEAGEHRPEITPEILAEARAQLKHVSPDELKTEPVKTPRSIMHRPRGGGGHSR